MILDLLPTATTQSNLLLYLLELSLYSLDLFKQHVLQLWVDHSI